MDILCLRKQTHHQNNGMPYIDLKNDFPGMGVSSLLTARKQYRKVKLIILKEPGKGLKKDMQGMLQANEQLIIF